MILRLSALCALIASIVLPGAAQDDATLPPDSAPMGGTITYIGNEGVMIAYSESKLIIDGLYEDGLEDYIEPPADITAAVKAGEEPFDGVTDIFVTHAHADHYSAAAVTDWLAANENGWAVMPADLPLDNRPAGRVGFRAVPLAARQGDPSAIFHGPNFSWRFLPVPHGDAQHFVYWLAIPPEPRAMDALKDTEIAPEDLTVLHLGDTDDYKEDLELYRTVFAEHETDVALVPYWLLDEPGLADMLNARQLIGIHVPAAGTASLDPDTMDWLAEPGETRVIYKSMEE